MEGYSNGKPDTAFWLRQVRLGLAYRKRCAYEANWPRWRNYYRGLWNPEILPSNLFFKLVRTMVPRIYFRNPSVSITSRRGGMEFHLMAQLLERTDNTLFVQMGLKRQIKKMVQDNFMFGTSIGKLGFGSQFQSTPETLGTTEAPLVRGKEALEYNILVQPNMPWFLRNPVSSYVIESGATDKDNARWDCYIIRRPVADIKADPRLRNNKEIGPSQHRSDVRSRDEALNSPVDMADLYEIRDRKTGKVFIISPSLNEKQLLFEDDEFFKLGVDPTNALVFNEDDEYFWGVPDAQILEPQQLEMNEIKTTTMYHRRLSVLKFLYKNGSIKKEELEKLLGPEIGASVAFDGNVQTDLKLLPGNNIPQDLTQSEYSVMQDVRESLGFSRNEFGEFKPGSNSPTATETNAVKASSEIRVDERRDMIADMITKLANDVHPIMFNHWTQEQVIEIVGPAGIPLWVAFRPTMLKRGQYKVMVDPDTSVPETKDLRTAKALKTYEILKMNPLINPVLLTRYLLRELHGVSFDDMMQGLPQGMGMSADQPIPFQQALDVYSKTAKNAPQLLPGPGTQQ